MGIVKYEPTLPSQRPVATSLPSHLRDVLPPSQLSTTPTHPLRFFRVAFSPDACRHGKELIDVLAHRCAGDFVSRFGVPFQKGIWVECIAASDNGLVHNAKKKGRQTGGGMGKSRTVLLMVFGRG